MGKIKRLIKVFKHTFRSFIDEGGNDLVAENNFYITLE